MTWKELQMISYIGRCKKRNQEYQMKRMIGNIKMNLRINSVISKLSYPMHPDHNKSTKGDRPSQSSRARSGLHGQLCQAQVVVAQLTQTRTPEAKANKTKQDSRWSSQSPTGPDDRSESLNTDLIFLKLVCLVFFKFYCS